MIPSVSRNFKNWVRVGLVFRVIRFLLAIQHREMCGHLSMEYTDSS